ncbi:hypothetical protein LCGC14_1117290 [marine sediment metagenome]|uniref:Glycosyltransferase 2-like domain-containing protein n=1 Tax=marine sediment metagenome TaxID=412755 RepID=A0A0F9M4Y4_9ZZZZ
MKCSICIATHNKSPWLQNTLKSIFRQSPLFHWEVIVVDDASTDDTEGVCKEYERVKYLKIDRPSAEYRNPSIARNIAYRAACGDVLVCQSDEVLHVAPNTIERLVNELQPKTFSIATVWNTDMDGNHRGLEKYPRIIQLTGIELQRPFFFLGAILRSDLYKAGGNDELYTSPGREDQAFADSLIHGLGLLPQYVNVVGHHVEHPRPQNLRELTQPSNKRYKNRRRLCLQGQESWLSPRAPWQF